MYQKIVLHVKLENNTSEAELNALLSDAVYSYGGEIVEIEDYQESCYSEKDFSKITGGSLCGIGHPMKLT